MEVCRICLANGCKLYSMKRYGLNLLFQELTGIHVASEDRLPMMLCVECSTKLQSYGKMRKKSAQSHQFLGEILSKYTWVSFDNLKNVVEDYRLKNSLKSNLREHFIKPFTYVDQKDDFDDSSQAFLKENATKPFSFKEINEDILTKDEMNENLELNFEKVTKENVFTPLPIPEEIEIKNEEIDYFDESVLLEEENDNKSELNSIKDDSDSSSSSQTPLTHYKSKKIKKKKVKNIKNNQLVLKSDNSLVPKEISGKKVIKLNLKHLKEKRKILKERKLKKIHKKASIKDRKEKENGPKIDRRRKPFLNSDLNETLFTVTNLSFEEQTAEIQKRKESLNFKSNAFKCGECFKGFLDEEAYHSHMFKHSEQAGAFQCEICKTRFSKNHALRKHITAHHTQRYSCNSCDYVTTHRQTARLHERWHNGTKYQCPHCADEFVKFTTYMGHIRIKHPSDFVCELCGYSFVSAKGIELHKNLKHRLDDINLPIEGPRCETCNVRFVTEEAYAKHLQVSARHKVPKQRKQRKPREPKSTKERASKEIRQSKELSEKKNYVSQIRKAEGPIACEQCGIQLEDSRAYHSHFRKVHPDKNRTQYPSMRAPCMCEQCGRMFQSYALLKDHRWTHTTEKPFNCDVCAKSFRMKQRLVAHMRVHSQQRASYVCNVCNKVFSTHSNRQRHVFIHTGLKPFKCELCGKSFKHASEKRAHHTYVHLKKPWPKRARRKEVANVSENESANMRPTTWGDVQYTNV